MTNRYCNLVATDKIKDSYGQITDGFQAVQDEHDAFPSSLYRQAIINGNFDIWQRGTSFSNPANGTFTADHWASRYVNTGTLPTTITHSKQSLTPGDIDGAYSFYRISPNGAGSGFGANDRYYFTQKVEFGPRYLAGSGNQVTVSFWARSSIASKKMGVNLFQNYGTGGSPSTGAYATGGTNFTLTSTWTRYTVTFTLPSISGKTFGTNNDDNLILQFYIMWGTSEANTVGASGVAETFGGSGNIDLAQVGMCLGDTALDFQPRSVAEEMALCQRYYEKSYKIADAPGTTSAYGGTIYQSRTAIAASTSGNLYTGLIPFRVRKRTIPTMTIYGEDGTANAVRKNTATVRTGATALQQSETGFSQISLDNSSAVAIALDDKIDFQWTADAEL